MDQSPFLVYNKDFVLFGFQHLAAIGLMIALAIFLPSFANKRLNPNQQLNFSRGMALFISFWVILYDVILIYLGKFNPLTDLPLDICNMMGLTLPLLMWNPSKRVFEYLYFWILAGTFQAVITPHLYNGFPNFIFIKYWVVHAGLIVYIIYAARVFGFSLTLRSLGKAFLGVQVYVVSIFLVNKLMGSNYVYVMHKPPTASALDYLGPWPWYILVGEAIALVLFFLVFLPYVNQKRRTA